MGCVVVRPDGVRIECGTSDLSQVLGACAAQDGLAEALRREQEVTLGFANISAMWTQWALKRAPGATSPDKAQAAIDELMRKGQSDAEDAKRLLGHFIPRADRLANALVLLGWSGASEVDPVEWATKTRAESMQMRVADPGDARLTKALRCMGWTGDCDPVEWAKKRTDEDVEAGRRVQQMGEELRALRMHDGERTASALGQASAANAEVKRLRMLIESESEKSNRLDEALFTLGWEGQGDPREWADSLASKLNGACAAAESITGGRPTLAGLAASIEACKSAMLDAKRRYESDLARVAGKGESLHLNMQRPAGWHDFNVNDSVRVKLTDKGKAWAMKDGGPSNPYRKQIEADGWSEWQLWELMQVFGSKMGNGFNLMFETAMQFSTTVEKHDRQRELIQAGSGDEAVEAQEVNRP